MDIVVKSHVGNIREVNEDSAAVYTRDDNKEIILAIVADGMGGHEAGDVASEMVLQSLNESFIAAPNYETSHDWEQWLKSSILKANSFVYDYAQQNQKFLGMGTTVVAVLFLDDYYLIGHVGDSRIYRFYENTVEQLTEDHSLVNELLRSGQISEEEALMHPQRNVITRALGTDETVEVDMRTLSYVDNETVLLCSDGLTSMVTDEQLLTVINTNQSLEQKADALVGKALTAGGDDNITLVLAKCGDASAAQKGGEAQ